LEYIQAHFTEYDISIEKVADIFNVSTTRVRQTVLDHTGQMYKEYLIALRIDYAKKLLLESDLPVSDVCNKCGYSSLSYFVKLFKKNTGTVPTAYKGQRQRND